jgi:hypothetical protein
MRQVSEVPRLKAQGLSNREIGQSLRLGKTTVRDYLEGARRAGLSWPLPEGLGVAGLEDRLFPSVPRQAARRPEPDWLEVHRELKQGRHVTRQLLWLEYKERRPEDGWGWTQFFAGCRRWLGKQEMVLRTDHRLPAAAVDELLTIADLPRPSASGVCESAARRVQIAGAGRRHAEGAVDQKAAIRARSC